MATSIAVKLISVVAILLWSFTSSALGVVPEDCQAESGDCVDKSKALQLKIIAIATILVTSMIGVGLPLVTRSIPALDPERGLFVVDKAFASGVILGTAFIHFLPDSFNMLSSRCLKENPWHKFPFTGFVAMLSALVTLMVDAFGTSIYTKRNNNDVIPENNDGAGRELELGSGAGQFHGGHGHHHHQGAPC